MLKKFWEIEDHTIKQSALSIDECTVVDHFNKTHGRDEQVKFIVPLHTKDERSMLRESTTLAIK